MLQLLITFDGQEYNYSQYVDWTTVSIQESINIPTTCAFTLIPMGQALPVPPVRAYVRIYSSQFDKSLFTGFISSPSVRAFLGKGSPAAVPQEQLGQYLAHQVSCTSDEHLLNIKAVPFITAYVNRTQGQILSDIANILCPGFFDTSEVLDGDIVPYFNYSPTQSWSEIAKQFADGSRYRYKVKDRKIWYVPYGDQPLGIVYDENRGDATFNAQTLNTTVLAVPTVNDITIIGDAEAGNNREDYFIGDGFTGNYPLLHKVFRGASTVLLQETWQNTELNLQNWFLLDPFANFDFSAGALNVVTAASGALGTSYLTLNNGVELAGGIDIQNGEITFTDYCLGVIGGVYTDSLFTSQSLLGGFFVSSPSGVTTSASGAAGIVIQPQWAGANIGPAVVTRANHTYVLQMVIHAPKFSRYDRIYRTIEGIEYGGVEKDVTGSVSFYIQDFDIAAATGFFYTPVITRASINDVDMPAFATYALINNQRLNVTIGNTSITDMPMGGLKAYVGPEGLYQPTGAILPMVPPGSGGYVGGVQPWPSTASGNILPAPAMLVDWETEVLGANLELQAAQITQGNNADTLAFYAQSLPAAGTPVRLQSWEQQAAVSRLQDQNSIIEEAEVVGDDGIRSAIVSDLNPLPRTSEDCDNAALAFLADRLKTQYNGTYTIESLFFKGLDADLQFYPTVGRFLNVNSPGRGIVQQKFLVSQLTITILSAWDELALYTIQFGVDLYLEKVLLHFVDLAPVSVLTPQDKAQPPNPRFTQNVDNSFLPDINDIQPVVIKDQTAAVTILNPQPYNIEVRSIDGNWGRQTVDLIGTFAPPAFTLRRQQYNQVWYMRYSQGGVFSRRSKVIRIMYPQQPSPPTFRGAGQIQAVGPSGSTISSLEIQLDYNGDVRNIYGIEIRAADNQTILYQAPATSYAVLNIDLSRTPMPFLPSPLNNDFSLYAYFFNHQWSYSKPLILAPLLLTGTREPYVWSPGYAVAASGDIVTKASFGVQPVYETNADGSGAAYVQIKGVPPPNLASTLAGEPLVQSATNVPGGALAAGTYLVAASARDSTSPTYGLSPLSNIVSVTANNGDKINVVLQLEVGTHGTDLYLSQTNGETWYWAGSLGDGVSSGSITGFDQMEYGAPDVLFDHFTFKFARVQRSGIGEYPVAAVTSNTLQLTGAAFGTNALAGRVVSLVAHRDDTLDLTVANYVIQSNTATTLTIGPNFVGNNPPDLTLVIFPNDIVSIRMSPASVTATGFSDSLLALTADEDQGLLAVIIYGTGAGQSVQIASNTTTGYTFTTALATPPDNTSVIVITNPNYEPTENTPQIATKNQSIFSGIVGTLNVENLAGGEWLIYALTKDNNDTGTFDVNVPLRTIYLFGEPGTNNAILAPPLPSAVVITDNGPHVLQATNNEELTTIRVAVTVPFSATPPQAVDLYYWAGAYDGNGPGGTDEQIKSGAATTLSLAIGTTPVPGTAETVHLASGVSALQGRYLRIDSEYMYVEIPSGGTPTVLRGCLGSTPATHALNAPVTIISLAYSQRQPWRELSEYFDLPNTLMYSQAYGVVVATVTNSFTNYPPVAGVASNELTLTLTTPGTRTVQNAALSGYSTAVTSWGASVQWTNNPDPALWYANLTVTGVDAFGNPDPSYPERVVRSDWKQGLVVEQFFGWGFPPPGYTYKFFRFQIRVSNRDDLNPLTGVLQQCWNNGGGANTSFFFDFDPTNPGGLPPIQQPPTQLPGNPTGFTIAEVGGARFQDGNSQEQTYIQMTATLDGTETHLNAWLVQGTIVNGQSSATGNSSQLVHALTANPADNQPQLASYTDEIADGAHYLIVDNEWMLITAAGSPGTVTRGALGTAIATHALNALVYVVKLGSLAPIDAAGTAFSYEWKGPNGLGQIVYGEFFWMVIATGNNAGDNWSVPTGIVSNKLTLNNTAPGSTDVTGADVVAYTADNVNHLWAADVDMGTMAGNPGDFYMNLTQQEVDGSGSPVTSEVLVNSSDKIGTPVYATNIRSWGYPPAGHKFRFRIRIVNRQNPNPFAGIAQQCWNNGSGINTSTFLDFDPTNPVTANNPGGLPPILRSPASALGANIAVRNVAGVMTVDTNLTIGDNLLINAAAESDILGWSGDTTTDGTNTTGFNTVTGQNHTANGNRSFSLNMALTGSAVKHIYQRIGCKPGDQFAASVWYKADNNSDAGLARIMIEFLDTTGAFISGTQVITTGAATTTWTQIAALSGKAPSNAALVEVAIELAGNSTTSGTWYYDDAYCNRMTAGSGTQATASGGYALNYGAAVADDGSGKITVLTAGPLFKDISGNLNLAFTTDFVVTGGQLTQQAVNLAKSYNFDTTNFVVSGGNLLINKLAVNQLIAGSALFLGTTVFAVSGGGQITINSSGITLANAISSPTSTVTIAASGITLARSSNNVQITASGVQINGPAGSLTATSGGVAIVNGANSLTITASAMTFQGSAGITINDGSGHTGTMTWFNAGGAFGFVLYINTGAAFQGKVLAEAIEISSTFTPLGVVSNGFLYADGGVAVGSVVIGLAPGTVVIDASRNAIQFNTIGINGTTLIDSGANATVEDISILNRIRLGTNTSSSGWNPGGYTPGAVKGKFAVFDSGGTWVGGWVYVNA